MRNSVNEQCYLPDAVSGTDQFLVGKDGTPSHEVEDECHAGKCRRNGRTEREADLFGEVSCDGLAEHPKEDVPAKK